MKDNVHGDGVAQVALDTPEFMLTQWGHTTGGSTQPQVHVAQSTPPNRSIRIVRAALPHIHTLKP